MSFLTKSFDILPRCRHMSEQPDRYGSGPLHTFSIGIAGSPDLAAAQKVADLIGTVHHGFTFTVQDGLDAIFDVIWHIESYEQIRASVPMYILSRKIKAMGYKVRHATASASTCRIVHACAPCIVCRQIIRAAQVPPFRCCAAACECRARAGAVM